jgi:carbonic anhydrase/acetyltransferase-like protein (isoleucine patch superfamily)
MLYALGSIKPTLGADTWIAPNATVIGDVIIGESSSIWFGVIVRGDVFPIRIGARTNVQDNAVVHVTGGKSATNIGDDVTIGHLALIHGCAIGNRCLIGMGSILLDDAVIEDDCLIAAGSLVPPRMRVPSRSFVRGRPGRVIRSVTEAELAQIREAGQMYVGYARRFGVELRNS